MSKQPLSAKDKAFEKERIKFRQEIRCLKHEIDRRDKYIKDLGQVTDEMSNEIHMLKDHIERLLEYTELDKEELKQALENQEKSAQLYDLLNSMTSVVSKMNLPKF